MKISEINVFHVNAGWRPWTFVKISTEEGIKQIKNNLDRINDWKNIIELIPDFYLKNKMKKTGFAGIFAASLELTKEGLTKVYQKKMFDKLMIKRT